MPKLWSTYALLDFGDHGLASARRDPRRVGLIELTDVLRWVPQQGEDWRVPIREVVVTSARGPLGLLMSGVGVVLPSEGPAVIRATSFAPGVATPRESGALADGARNGRLRKELVRRGAAVVIGGTEPDPESYMM